LKESLTTISSLVESPNVANQEMFLSSSGGGIELLEHIFRTLHSSPIHPQITSQFNEHFSGASVGRTTAHGRGIDLFGCCACSFFQKHLSALKTLKVSAVLMISLNSFLQRLDSNNAQSCKMHWYSTSYSSLFLSICVVSKASHVLKSWSGLHVVCARRVETNGEHRFLEPFSTCAASSPSLECIRNHT
jgi:hypothetical protein